MKNESALSYEASLHALFNSSGCTALDFAALKLYYEILERKGYDVKTLHKIHQDLTQELQKGNRKLSD